MRMEEGLDTGAYCVCRTASVGDLSAEELTDELAILGSHALLTALVRVERGVCDWTEQDESRVTYADKIAKGELDLSVGAVELLILKPAGKQAMDAKSFAAGIQGIKDGGLIWKGLHA